MSNDRHGLFEQLEPPAGGTEQLRRRLEAAAEERRGPRRPLVIAASAALVAGLVAVAVLFDAERFDDDRFDDDRNGERNPDREPDPVVASLYEAPQFDRLLGRPLERTEPSVTLNDRTANVAEVHTASEKVRLYRLE